MPLPDMEIRPRGSWEAVDLGVRLAQRHLPRLMLAWAALTVPVFLLLSALCWKYPSVVGWIIWWLKPLFERLPLYILSRGLFGETPGVRQSLRALPGQLRNQWFASLTWRRLSPTRAFDLPVTQLEGLGGKARQQRLAVLGQRTSGVATLLTIIGMHLEIALLFGLLALLYLLLPAPVVADWEWQDLLSQGSEWLWLEHLSNALYVLVLIVWEPIYVACGFSLYLNRRTELEGWDIELGFRRLRQRLPAATTAAALLLGLFCLPAAEPALAEAQDLPGPQEERLQHQGLTSREAREQIEALLANPPFEHSKTITSWRFGSDDQTKPEEPAPEDFFKGFQTLRDFFENLAPITEALLWVVLFAILALLVWRHHQWLSLFGKYAGPGRLKRPPPTVMFGLAVSPDSLPADVAGEAERLWDESPRQALSLLYRATLSHLLHQFQLPLKSSHTEQEVLALLAPSHPDAVYAYTAQLTDHWQCLAYGHHPVPAAVGSQLCQGYRRLFTAGAAA